MIGWERLTFDVAPTKECAYRWIGGSMKSDTYWRKRCRCGADYGAVQWLTLPYVGRLKDEEDDLELRNCTDCGSTISVPTRLVDRLRHA